MYFQAPFITIDWDDQTECVVSTMKGFAEGKAYRKALDKGLELLERHGSNKWLGDMRNGAVMNQDDLAWVQNDWRPRATKAGLCWTALVMKDQALARMQIDRLTKTIERVEGRNIETAYFDDVDEAKAWLRSVG
jgi:hypothetical protein